MNVLDIFFHEASAAVDQTLEHLVSPSTIEPKRLFEAIRWSLFAGGKRLRPALVIAAGRIFGASEGKLLRTAAAVEMIHTYSLVHDDLPSMDNDDLRRGRETCHKKFGDATAILAGDALQALAFQTIAEDQNLTEPVRITLLLGLGRAAACMVAGQQLDLAAEGRAVSIEEVRNIHANKTGALIAFSVYAGALIGDAADDELKAVGKYGSNLGLLFQITDDLLDITESTESLGKTAGKDIESEKATYPKILGAEAAGNLAADVAADAIGALDEISKPTTILRDIVEFLMHRRS